jgi:hypothetical protein
MQEIIKKAKTNFKCSMDGEVVEDEFLRIACLRTEEGQTISLTQILKED